MVIVEGPPVRGLFDSRVDKIMSSYFRIYQLFSETVVEYLLPPRLRMNEAVPD